MLRQYFSLPKVLLKRKVFYAVFLLLIIGCISQFPRRPATSRRSMPSRRSNLPPEEPQNTTVTTDSSLTTSSSEATSMWNYYRPSVPLRDLIPDSRPKMSSTPAGSGNMIILVGAYTAVDFAARPHLYSVAVEVKENQTLDELATMSETKTYAEVFYFSNSASNDFFEIVKSDNAFELRLMPKSAYTLVNKIYVPRDAIFHAQLWAGSRMLECLNLTNLRNPTEPPNLIPEDVYWLSVMRDLHFKYRALPFLISGTLLGWRRECTVIPHTTDMDIAIFEDEFPMALVEDSINMTGKPLQLARIIGRPGDSYEATFWAKTRRGKWFTIDMFTMYRDLEKRMCYTTLVYDKPDYQKYRNEYPWFEAEFCTANLHGHVFHVPCDPDPILEADYGVNWRVDRHTKGYFYEGKLVANGNFSLAGETLFRTF